MKVLIAGAGKLGYKIASSLIQEDYEITVLDIDPDVIENITNHLDVLTINGDAMDFEILREVEIDKYDVLIATTTSDEGNILLATTAKSLGCKKTIARISNPEYSKQIPFITKELNIDYCINPDYVTAGHIERYLMKKHLLMGDEFADGMVRLVEFNIGKDLELIGKKLKDLDGVKDLLIASVLRNGKTIIPNGETILEKNDVIIIVGREDRVAEFDKTHSEIKLSKKVRKLMIMGGGTLAVYLSRLLEKSGVEVVIVDNDIEVCKYLKEILDNVTVIYGDGTDFDLLEEEMISSFDAFVAATGHDETNLLMALSIKQFGVYKSVAKISRSNYNTIIDKLDLDGAFNKSVITAAEVVSYLRSDKPGRVNLTLQGDAEFTDYVLDENFQYLDKAIIDMRLPRGILIVSVVRGKKVIIPNGSTVLKKGDRVIVFCLHENLQKLKQVFNRKKGKSVLDEIRSHL